MKRVAAVGITMIGLVLGPASLASAEDVGNHEAIWKADQHGSLTSGSDWGAMIGDMASTGELKPYGVSEGVHVAKGHAVPGQNK